MYGEGLLKLEVNYKVQRKPRKNLNLLLLHTLLPNRLLLLARVIPRNRRHAASKSGVVLGSARDLASKLLESLALGLRDQKRGETAQEHEQSVDLHDVVEPGRLVLGSSTTGAERTDEDLGDDGADLARGSGDTV